MVRSDCGGGLSFDTQACGVQTYHQRVVSSTSFLCWRSVASRCLTIPPILFSFYIVGFFLTTFFTRGEVANIADGCADIMGPSPFVGVGLVTTVIIIYATLAIQ